jgi:hypothetical protein
MLEHHNVKIVKVQHQKSNILKRNGARGPARKFFNKNGDLCEYDGHGNFRQINFARDLAIGITAEGHFYQTDIRKCVKHCYPNSRSNWNSLIRELISAIFKVADGNVSITHYPDSNKGWIEDEDVRGYIEAKKFMEGYTRFAADENDELGPDD